MAKSPLQIKFSNNISGVGRGLSLDEAYLMLEIPQEIPIYWHNLKVKTKASFASLLQETNALPFRLMNTPALE